MANVIIKSEERLQHEAYVRNSFGVAKGDAAGAEACEVIAAKSREAVEIGKRQEGKRSWS